MVFLLFPNPNTSPYSFKCQPAISAALIKQFNQLESIIFMEIIWIKVLRGLKQAKLTV
jgi:hypothetical protein